MQGVMLVAVRCKGDYFVLAEFDYEVAELNPGRAMRQRVIFGSHVAYAQFSRETGDRRNVFWSRAGGPRFPAFPSRHHNVRGAMSSPAGRFLWITEIAANVPV